MQQCQGPNEIGNCLLLKLAQAEQSMLADSSQQALWWRVGKGGVRYHGQCQCLHTHSPNVDKLEHLSCPWRPNADFVSTPDPAQFQLVYLHGKMILQHDI